MEPRSSEEDLERRDRSYRGAEISSRSVGLEGAGLSTGGSVCATEFPDEVGSCADGFVSPDVEILSPFFSIRR